MALGREDFDSDQDYLIYCAARDIYRRRGQMVPSGKYTWERWFEKRYGCNYEGYISELSNRTGERPA